MRQLEGVSAGERSLLIKMVVDGGMAVLGDQCEPVSTKMAAHGSTQRTPGDFLSF